jgi:hypothetical protein
MRKRRAEYRRIQLLSYRAMLFEPNTWTAIAAIGSLGSAITSAAVCFATFRILAATRQTLEDARNQADQARRPVVEIAAWPKPHETIVMLSIRNTGNGAARNLRLKLSHNFFFNGEEDEANNIRNYPVFQKRIESLSPRAEIDLLLGVGHVLFAKPDLCPLQFMVEATYTFEQKEFIERTFIDLAPFSRHAAFQDPHIEQLKNMATGIQAISKAIEARAHVGSTKRPSSDDAAPAADRDTQ